MTQAEPIRPIKDLSDFRLFTSACECRYSNAYLLWDRAGAIWAEFSDAYPSIRMLKADPGQTIFRLEERFEFNLRLDRFSVHSYGISASDEFAAVVEKFASIATRQLQIESYSRIGMRPIFYRDYPDEATATAHLLALNLLRVPAQPSFGISGVPKNPRYIVHWEDKSKGCMIHVYVQRREFEPEALPFAWEGPPLKRLESTVLAVDVDYYTVASATVGQVNLREWITQAMHVIRRDASQFLEGK